MEDLKVWCLMHGEDQYYISIWLWLLLRPWMNQWTLKACWQKEEADTVAPNGDIYQYIGNP